MSAIPAASVNMRTLADGTLRLTIDIEPKDAQDAFRLFAAPGTPVAIAALQVGYAAAVEPEKKEPLGPLAMWLVLRCKEPEFWAWINSHTHEGDFWSVNSEAEARDFMCNYLDLNSRREADEPEVAARVNEFIRGPYQRWCLARGVA